MLLLLLLLLTPLLDLRAERSIRWVLGDLLVDLGKGRRVALCLSLPSLLSLRLTALGPGLLLLLWMPRSTISSRLWRCTILICASFLSVNLRRPEQREVAWLVAWRAHLLVLPIDLRLILLTLLLLLLGCPRSGRSPDLAVLHILPIGHLLRRLALRQGLLPVHLLLLLLLSRRVLRRSRLTLCLRLCEGMLSLLFSSERGRALVVHRVERLALRSHELLLLLLLL